MESNSLCVQVRFIHTAYSAFKFTVLHLSSKHLHQHMLHSSPSYAGCASRYSCHRYSWYQFGFLCS